MLDNYGSIGGLKGPVGSASPARVTEGRGGVKGWECCEPVEWPITRSVIELPKPARRRSVAFNGYHFALRRGFAYASKSWVRW